MNEVLTVCAVAFALCLFSSHSVRAQNQPGNVVTQHGSLTADTGVGRLVVRSISTDTSIVGDSVRIRGVVYESSRDDKGADTTWRRSSTGYRVVLRKPDGSSAKEKLGRTAEYDLMYSAGALHVSIGSQVWSCALRVCPSMEFSTLPPQTVVVVDAYLRYDVKR